MQKRDRTGRIAGYVDVDRQHLIDPAEHLGPGPDPAAARVGPGGDHDPGLGHRLVGAAQRLSIGRVTGPVTSRTSA